MQPSGTFVSFCTQEIILPEVEVTNSGNKYWMYTKFSSIYLLLNYNLLLFSDSKHCCTHIIDNINNDHTINSECNVALFNVNKNVLFYIPGSKFAYQHWTNTRLKRTNIRQPFALSLSITAFLLDDNLSCVDGVVQFLKYGE